VIYSVDYYYIIYNYSTSLHSLHPILSETFMATELNITFSG